MSVSAMSFGREWFEPVPLPTTSGPPLTPLSGRVLGASYPGLKPWAILFRHFMAIYPTPPYSNAPLLHHSNAPLPCSP